MCLLTFVALVLGIFVYPMLPDMIATHWNLAGVADGFMSKFWALFLMPFILFTVFLIWAVIPHLEPMKKNLAAFQEAYNGFFLVLSVFLFYIYMLTLGANLGGEFNFVQALAPAFTLLFLAVGVLMEHTKRNFFVGIRTPWTLSSDKVWKKTHQLAAPLFYFTAASTFVGLVYPDYFFAYMFFPLFGTIVITVLYSFVEYRHEKA